MMRPSHGSKFEPLEPRRLFAVRTVDFDNYPVNFTQFDWMLQNAHTTTSGFSYATGTGDGQRPNINGITWADAGYYETALGAGAFGAVNSWNMKPVVLYTQAKNGNWLTQGWNYVPDMAEGHAAVDDAARAAVAYADDYLLNGTASSYQTARDILTFVAYMTTRQGKVYNFAWLDAPATFGYDPIYSQDKHFQYRVEYNKRTAYPSATPNGTWFDPNSTTSQIINWPSPVRASPFTPHAKHSVYIDDLRDASNNDVAKIYDGPLYTTAAGAPTSFKTGIKKTWTNSTQAFGFDEGRAIMAISKGLMMMQKREAEMGTLSADELTFARFLENNANRMVRNFQTQSVNSVDSKLGSAILSGLADYYQLFYGTNEYGAYPFKLEANSNTIESTDDRPIQSSVLATIDALATNIKNRQVRTADWRNGIFSDDGTGQNWDAWGQFQIAALARTYRLKVNIGQDPSSVAVASLLDYSAYAADNFYGIEAYHYLVPGTNNVRTKERITGISGGGARYHNNSGQIAYHNASIVAGLRELTLAYDVSGRADKATRMATYLNGLKSVASWFIGNNTSLLDMYDAGGLITGTFRGRGAVFDGIDANGSAIPNINRNTGGESFSEGVWAIVLAKASITDFGVASTFAFETGSSTAVRPTVNASSFDFNAAKPTLRFSFSQDVGPSLHAFDIVVTNLQSSATVPTSSLALAYNQATRQLSVTFPGQTSGILSDGNYQVVVRSTGVVGNSGNPMAADHQLSFFALAGDANHDATVNLDDFTALAANFGTTSATFSKGDFNYDTVIDLDDFTTLASQFGQTLPTEPARAAFNDATLIGDSGHAGNALLKFRPSSGGVDDDTDHPVTESILNEL